MQNMNDYGFYGNIGLAVKGIEIYFPVSKTLCIGMWCTSHEEGFNELYTKYTYLKNNEPWLVEKIIGDTEYIEQLKLGLDTGCPIPSQPDNVINHNSLQVKYASRFVFSCNNDFSLVEEMLESNPELAVGPRIGVS